VREDALQISNVFVKTIFNFTANNGKLREMIEQKSSFSEVVNMLFYFIKHTTNAMRCKCLI